MKNAVLITVIALLASACSNQQKQDSKEAARDVGQTTKEVGREIGHATRDATREAGHFFRDVFSDEGEGAAEDNKD